MTRVTQNSPDEWASFLDPDEHIIWQGRPATGLRLKPRNLIKSPFGIFFLGYAIFWTSNSARTGGTGFLMFGLPFIAAGLWLVFGKHIFDSLRRGRTHYTLTNKRAFIATDLFGRKLQSFVIHKNSPLEYHPGPPDTIIFAIQDIQTDDETVYQDIGFELIDDGPHVYELLREIQGKAS